MKGLSSIIVGAFLFGVLVGTNEEFDNIAWYSRCLMALFAFVFFFGGIYISSDNKKKDKSKEDK